MKNLFVTLTFALGLISPLSAQESIQSDLCVGVDCSATGESEDWTLVLKENNTSILFDDTSSGAFPLNDWAIVANDTTSGGDSYLGFQDVTAGSTLFKILPGSGGFEIFGDLDMGGFDVLDVGSLGVGTLNPSELLHLRGSSQALLRSETSSGGRNMTFGAQDSDPFTHVGTTSNHSFNLLANGARRVRIGGNGGVSIGTSFASSVAPAEGLIVEGNVGIGTTSPAGTLDVNGSIFSGTLDVTGITTLSSDLKTGDWTIPSSTGTFVLQDASAGTEFFLTETGNLTLEGSLTATSGSFSGTLSTATINAGSSSITTTGAVNGGTGSFSGAISGTSVNYPNNWTTLAPGSFIIDDTSSANLELALASDGDLFIEGFLSEGSSRETKHNLVAISPEDAILTASKIQVYEWSRNGSETRHVGPMAEDFYAVTGLGEDPRKISPGDQAGLNLAAIQGLLDRIEALEARVEDLESCQD